MKRYDGTRQWQVWRHGVLSIGQWLAAGQNGKHLTSAVRSAGQGFHVYGRFWSESDGVR
jgi:hypothetical protein